LRWTDPQTNEVSSGYREQGYFSDAFVNMLVFLGWNPGTNQEVFTKEELIEAFTLARVGKAGAKFDADKTKWFNQQYLRAQSNETLAELMLPFAQNKGYDVSTAFLAKIAQPLKERATFVEQMIDEGIFFFEAPSSYDAQTLKKKWKANTPQYLTELRGLLADLSNFEENQIEEAFKSILAKHEIGFGQLGPGFRLAVTGLGMGPSLFQICAILGQAETLKRIDKALETLG